MSTLGPRVSSATDVRDRWFRSAPHLVTLAVVCIELALILYLNHGRFSYTLDDAYIHLALSDHLSRLHYGINADESSSPSSSVLYPVLLAPFAPWSFHEYVPLVLNVAALLATMSVIGAVLRRTGFEAGRSRAFGDGLAILLALSLNLIGLVFTGMEHSLHVLVTLTVVLGLVVLVQEDRVTWWLLAAIVVGPLVRYEGAAVSLGAVAVLALCRKWRPAFGAGLLCLGTLGAFSAFLVSLGLPALPSSVLVKSAVAASGVDTGLFKSLRPLVRNLLRPSLSATLLMLLGALVVARLIIEQERRARRPVVCLTAFTVVVVGAHLAAGHYGWFARYEIYAVAAASLTAIHLWGSELRSVADRAGSVRTLAATALLAAIFAGPQYVRATVSTPLAASNIYEQQYQMHRFAAEYYKGPVAVNDLGRVAYRNPHYVLDLSGLGSESARQASLVQADGATWIADLMNRQHVELAMVYDDRFEGSPPTSWRRIAILHLGRPRVVVPMSAVAFYSTSPERVPEVLAQLRRFRETLPAGTRLEILLP